LQVPTANLTSHAQTPFAGPHPDLISDPPNVHSYQAITEHISYGDVVIIHYIVLLSVRNIVELLYQLLLMCEQTLTINSIHRFEQICKSAI